MMDPEGARTRAPLAHACARTGVTLRAVALLVALSSGAACKQAPSSESLRPSPPPAAVPVDHLAPGELPEGSATAFGIVLPRGVQIDRAFAQVVFASGKMDVHSFVQYLQPRLEGGSVHESETRATFDGVHAKGDTKRQLRIVLEHLPLALHIEFRDVTLPPAPDLPNDEARWRHVGLTPDGRLVDRTHLE
jgi:hypothetical protein